MDNLPKEDLLELKTLVSKALEMTNEKITNTPASESYDEIFSFLTSKAKHYVSLLERIEEQLKQK